MNLPAGVPCSASLHEKARRKSRRGGLGKEARASVLFINFSGLILKKIFGKVIDGRCLEVLLRPSQHGASIERRRRRNAGDKDRFFPQTFSESFSKIFGKGIDERATEVLVRPSQHGEPIKFGDDELRGGKTAVLSSRIFRKFEEIFGKRIDEENGEVLVRNLSLIGKLFEIYFVRLIGTPNQQFKKRSQL